MKSAKPIRTTKPSSSQARLTARKVSSSARKQAPLPSSSSPHMSSSARHASLRGMSPNAKHGTPRSKKHSHSPRPPSYPPSQRSQGSPIVDRMHSSKRPVDYEKRRIASHPAVSRIPPTSLRSVTHRHLSPSLGPHPHSRIHSNSPGSSGLHYSSPPKKKLHRDSAHISSPPQGFEKSHMASSSHVTHKSSAKSTPSVYHHERDRAFSSITSRSSYSLQERPRDGYNLSSRAKSVIEPSYPPIGHKRIKDGGEYISERGKRYSLTLNERFRSSAEDPPPEDHHQHVQFTREDLENITIDIKRNLRDCSPTLRHIVDPSEVKLVRRPSEGHRPIFDREEIKQAPRDLREDAYYEQKVYGTSGDRIRPATAVLNYKDMENYEITRHKFDSHSVPLTDTYTLNEKWRMLGQKPSSTLDRDERPHAYRPRSRSPPSFTEKRRPPRPRSVDQDFRPVMEHRPKKPDYPPPAHKPLPVNPADLRHSLAVRRKDGSVHDARERLMERRLIDRDHPPSGPTEPRYSNHPKYSSNSYRTKERSPSGSHRIESHEFSSHYSRSSDRMRSKAERSPDYPPHSDRMKYSSWEEKPSSLSKPFNYYEPEDRDGGDSFYTRGASRGFRGRGFRGRFFRGNPMRGMGFRGRGSYHSSLSPRGRNYPPKRSMPSSYQ